MSGLTIEATGMKNSEPPVLVVNGHEYVGIRHSTQRMVMEWAPKFPDMDKMNTLVDLYEALKVTSDFLIYLGFPQEVVDDLESNDIIKAAFGFFTGLAFQSAS